MKSRSVIFAAVVAALVLSFSPSCGRRTQPPVVDSAVVVRDGSTSGGVKLTVRAHDPGGDSIRLRVEWGDKSDTVTGFFSSPCSVDLGHQYTIDTLSAVIVSAFDMNNFSIPIITTAPIEPCGRVLWYWQSLDQGAMMTSALVAIDGEDEVVMSYCWDDFRFYSIKVGNGRAKCYATTQQTEQDFSSSPALCAATGHVIVGSEEGEIYALALGTLARAWRWPDIPNETLEPYIPFGAPAISGSDIYVGRYTDADSLDRLYKFTDAGGSVTPGPTYVLHGQSVVDAPAIDAAGSVYFGTDGGYLYKIDANLSSPLWKRHLLAVGEINGPIIGGDGTIYCGTESLGFYAINSDSTTKWTITLDGVGARPALGQAALFVATEMGSVYSINPQTGAINWRKSYTPGIAFTTTPIVAANGYLYIQDDNDVLYCVKQADGADWWVCDCNRYLPGGGRNGSSSRPRRLGLINYDPNPSITSTGNIIVVGQNALFCVAGYPTSPLDPLAPWPKWQRDLYNTGKVW
jgi:outer membrane protein assembly factor BamB